MIFGHLVGLKLPDICLTVRKKPQKTSHRKLVPTGDRMRARCMTGAHAIACSLAVDQMGKHRLKLLNEQRKVYNLTKQLIWNRDVPIKNT